MVGKTVLSDLRGTQTGLHAEEVDYPVNWEIKASTCTRGKLFSHQMHHSTNTVFLQIDATLG